MIVEIIENAYMEEGALGKILAMGVPVAAGAFLGHGIGSMIDDFSQNVVNNTNQIDNILGHETVPAEGTHLTNASTIGGGLFGAGLGAKFMSSTSSKPTPSYTRSSYRR